MRTPVLLIERPPCLRTAPGSMQSATLAGLAACRSSICQTWVCKVGGYLMCRSSRFGFRPTGRRSTFSKITISCASFEPMAPRSRSFPYRPTRTVSSCRPFLRLPPLRSCHQLAAAVGADGLHAVAAAGTERALVAADPGLAIGRQSDATLLAGRPHFERHTVAGLSLTNAAAGGRARRLLRGPHRCERRSPCRFRPVVAASAQAAVGIV